jgi:T-complex protein 1 subunit eta
MNQYLFTTEKVQDSRSGVAQIISNIEICNTISAFLSTTLGPYGLDKLFYGKKTVMTNDGATILENMNFKHPVARMMAALSKSQDNEVGDGTTSVIILTTEILNCLKPLIKENYSIDLMKKCLKELRKECIQKIEELKIEFSRENLIKLAETCLNSKNVRNDKSHFAHILVEGLTVEDELHINKIQGGSLRDSLLVGGIAFEKTFTYAGYEQQPKKILNPKICCLNVELEWRSEKDNAEIRIESIGEYKNVVDAEWSIIKEKLDDIVDSGANVVLSALPIGDYATQYFARKGIFSAGRVHDLDKIIKAFKGRIASSTKFIELSQCDLFEERQLGKARYNYFEGKTAKSHTLILRGPGSEVLDEVERSVHDAICVIRTALKHKNIVTGGGSVEMELSKMCRERSLNASDERMFIYRAVSKAFEKIPSQLAENFGLDSVSVLQNLRKAHSSNEHAGVSLGGVGDMKLTGVYEPLEVKKNMIKAALNAAEAILMIDSTIISKK